MDGNCSHEIERLLLLGRKAMTKLGSILKSRDITLPTKVPRVEAMVFPVVMYQCENWTINKAECWRTNAFQLWCWITLESPLDSKEIKPVNPKRNRPRIFKGLKLQYFSHSCKELTHWKRPWCWERLRAREGDNRGWDGWMISLTQCTTWANSGRWWRKGKPGVLQSMDRELGHNSLTEQQQKILTFKNYHPVDSYSAHVSLII